MPKQKTQNVDVTVNVTAHKEGILLHKTLRSILAGITYANEKGLRVEWNVSLDNADQETKDTLDKFVKEYKSPITIHNISAGDLGLSRNYLIENSTGKYIVFFDGDDFFTENYIYQAFMLAESNPEPAIYSPRYLICFEGDHYLIEKLDSNSFTGISKNLFETNYYISQNFVHYKVYEKLKYQSNTDGFGMEDWHFNCEATAAGIKFYNVPDTIFFYRRKKTGSLLVAQVQSSAITRPTKLFEPQHFASLPVALQSENLHEGQRPQNLSRSIRLKDSVIKALQKHELTFHYSLVQYTLHRNIVRALKNRYIKKSSNSAEEDNIVHTPVPYRLKRIGFSEELVKLWGRLNQYEPMIRASADMLNLIPIVDYPRDSALSDFYYGICKKYGDLNISDLVLVPHLVRGGADLAAINLIKELDKKGKKVLIVTTLDVESPWLHQVQKLKNVVYIESKYDLKDISEENKILLLVKLIQNWKIKRLSIVNAELGYKIATTYSRALKNVGCKVYLHTYAFNMTEDGYMFNWIPNGLVDAYKGVDYFVTDSSVYKEQLHEINGFSRNKVRALYLPVSTGTPQKTDYSTKRRILWASRVCDDKLIEVLVEIGKKLKEHNVQLDIWGSIDQNYAVNDMFLKMIEPYENITYKGSYEGFGSLDTNKYDMFLMTTKNEGMPNVILEACEAGIYIVAANVGGIPECIDEGVNGSLIDQKFNPTAYFDAIMEAYDAKRFSKPEIMAQKNNIVLARHSTTAYRKAVIDLMDL